MLNEVNVKIKLTRSRDAFCLMASGDQPFKVKITAAAMIVRKVKISPSAYLAHAKTLETSLAKYPLKRVICKTFKSLPAFLTLVKKNCLAGSYLHD
jgi:hypothetical protein